MYRKDNIIIEIGSMIDTKLTKHISFKNNYLLGERSDNLSLETKLIVNALLLLKQMWRRKSRKARIQNNGEVQKTKSCSKKEDNLAQKGRQPYPKRKTTLPKKEDDITKKRRQLYSLLIGQILLVCSLCDIFLFKFSSLAGR